MNITDYFIQKGLKTVPEVTDNRFSMIDDGAIETETGELVYGFIRRLKPTNVLSTGIYTGISDLYIAQALQDNGFGHLTAIEFEKFHLDRASELWVRMGVRQQITPVLSDSLKFETKDTYQFMFLDTEPMIRWAELERFYQNLDVGGFVFIHDTPRNLCQGNYNPDHPDFKSWPFGDVSENFKRFVVEDKLRPFHWGSSRGLVGFYKVHPDDFIWK